jgi:predicted nucleotidyltransferase
MVSRKSHYSIKSRSRRSNKMGWPRPGPVSGKGGGFVSDISPAVFSGIHPPVLFAYVFGSSGTREENVRSDLDLAVYLDMPDGQVGLEEKLSLYAEISRAAGRNDIDIVVLNTCTNLMLLYEVMTKGRLVFDADPGARMVFEQRTLHAAIDFKEQRDRIFS